MKLSQRKLKQIIREELIKVLNEQDPFDELEGELEKAKKKVKCPNNVQEGKAMAKAALKEAAGKRGHGDMDVMRKYCISEAKRKGRRTLVVFKNGIRVVV